MRYGRLLKLYVHSFQALHKHNTYIKKIYIMYIYIEESIKRALHIFVESIAIFGSNPFYCLCYTIFIFLNL